MKKIVKVKADQLKAWLLEKAAVDVAIQPHSRKVLDCLNRMLHTILANQTADEQVTAATRHNNGEGFTATDAEILTSIAQRSAKWGLSQKQARLVCRKLAKYTRQLAEAALQDKGLPQNQNAVAA